MSAEERPTGRTSLLVEKAEHELRAAIAAAEAENAELRRDNAHLVRRKDMERIGVAYYLTERDGAKTGPICPVCYERDGVPRLLVANDTGAECRTCKGDYPGVTGGVEPPSRTVY